MLTRPEVGVGGTGDRGWRMSQWRFLSVWPPVQGLLGFLGAEWQFTGWAGQQRLQTPDPVTSDLGTVDARAPDSGTLGPLTLGIPDPGTPGTPDAGTLGPLGPLTPGIPDSRYL